MEEFDYFMIRIRRPVADPLEHIVSGVVERLGMGEKWSFATGEELLQFVCGDSRLSGNMHRDLSARNASGS